jgi:hypothetical protein
MIWKLTLTVAFHCSELSTASHFLELSPTDWSSVTDVRVPLPATRPSYSMDIPAFFQLYEHTLPFCNETLAPVIGSFLSAAQESSVRTCWGGKYMRKGPLSLPGFQTLCCLLSVLPSNCRMSHKVVISWNQGSLETPSTPNTYWPLTSPRLLPTNQTSCKLVTVLLKVQGNIPICSDLPGHLCPLDW